MNQNIASKPSYCVYWYPTQPASFPVVTTSALLFVTSIYHLPLKLAWKLFESGMRPVKCPIPSKAFECSANMNSMNLQLWNPTRSICIHTDTCMHNKCMKNICEIGTGVVMVFYCLLLCSGSVALTKYVFYTALQNSALHVLCLGNQSHKTNHVQWDKNLTTVQLNVITSWISSKFIWVRTE